MSSSIVVVVVSPSERVVLAAEVDGGQNIKTRSASAQLFDNGDDDDVEVEEEVYSFRYLHNSEMMKVRRLSLPLLHPSIFDVVIVEVDGGDATTATTVPRPP